MKISREDLERAARAIEPYAWSEPLSNEARARIARRESIKSARAAAIAFGMEVEE